MKPPRPNRYRTHWAGAATRRAGRRAHPRSRLGPPPPRPRRPDLHRPARPRPGLLQLVFRPDEAPEAHAAAGRLRVRGRAQRQRRARQARGGRRQPQPPDRRGRARRVEAFELLADAETPPFQIDEDEPVGEELRLRYRYLDLRKERMPRHAPAAPRRGQDDPRPLERRGLPRDRDADPDPLHARGRTRLPRAEPAGARLLVRAAAVAAALQAAADDGRRRALLPDRALLPRRGLPCRPPARVHPARPGDGLRGRGGRDRDDRPTAAARARARRDRGLHTGRAHRLRRGDAALRLRPPRPPPGAGDHRPHRGLRGARSSRCSRARWQSGGVVRALKAGGEWPR